MEGGWPLAHEMGHLLAESDATVSAILERQVDEYIEYHFGTAPPPGGPPNARDRLLAEIHADHFGAELILRSLAGRPLDYSGLVVLLSEFAANSWIMMLMESCKATARLACTEPELIRTAAEHPSGQQSWMYDIRRRLLFNSIWADLSSWPWSDPSRAEAEIERLILGVIDTGNPAMATYLELLGGLSASYSTMLGDQLPYPFLEGLNPHALEFWDWDAAFSHLADGWARSPFWQGATREFVDRARATANFRDQPTDLIDHLDRLVPTDILPVDRRRLQPEW